MPPPPPPKRIKRPPKVLDEETYTSALSHIIARDFFPGLLESESQQDYLNALDAGDDEWIEEAEKRVKEVLNTPRAGRRGVSMTPRGIGGETPRGWRGETPLATPRMAATPARSGAGESTQPLDESHVDLNLSLEAFQAKYTSEDNESFNKVLDRQNAKKREKYGWLWNSNMLPSARRIAQAAVKQKLLKQASDRNAEGAGKSDEQALTLRPSQDLDLRPAGIAQIRPYEPRNNFMFIPPDVSEARPDLTSTFQAAQDASRAAPKSVSYAATRLPTALHEDFADDASTVSESPALSAIDAAISGRPRHRAVSTVAPSELDDDGSETPRVNGYAFVDAEPTPSELGIPPSPPPAQRKQRDDTLLRRLIESHGGGDGDGGAGGPNPFNIQERSRREALHHRMVDKQLASKRVSAVNKGRLAALQSGGKTPTPRFTSSPAIGRRVGDATPGGILGGGLGATGKTPVARRERMEAGNLTPAAQSLYEKVGRTPVRVGGGGAFDHGEKSARERPQRTPRVRKA